MQTIYDKEGKVVSTYQGDTPLTQQNLLSVGGFDPSFGFTLNKPAVAPQITASNAGVSSLSSTDGQSALKETDKTAQRLGIADTNTYQGTGVTEGMRVNSQGFPVDDKGKIIPGFSADERGMVVRTENVTAPKEQNKVTFIKADTGQEYELVNPTKEQIESFKQNGWDVATGTGDGAGVTPTSEASQAVRDARSELDTQKKKLFNFDVSKDPILKSMLDSISSQWDARISEMERVGKSRVAAIETGAIRRGGRYTGGIRGGIEGGIITEEERQGVARVTELQAKKQDALLTAQQAYSKQEWDKYAKLVDVAQDYYDATTKELEELNKVTIAENKTREEAEAKVEAEKTKTKTDMLSDLAKNNAPQSVIDAVNAEDDVAGMATAAGSWLQTASGDLGEVLAIEREILAKGGTPPSRESLLTKVANQKARAATLISGLPSNVSTQVDKLSAAFDSAPITKQYNEVLNKKLSVDSIINTGIKGPADLALVFEFMKSLDPNSVVRETEYETASKSGNIFAGWAARFNGYLTAGGGFLPDQVRADFQSLTNAKLGVIEKQYSNLRSEQARKIEMKTKTYDPNTPGSDYLTDYAAATKIADSVVADESAIEARVIEAGNKDPKVQEIALKLQEEDGLSIQEVYEYLQAKGYTQ